MAKFMRNILYPNNTFEYLIWNPDNNTYYLR